MPTDTFTVAADTDDGYVQKDIAFGGSTTYTESTGDVTVYQAGGSLSTQTFRRGVIRFNTAALPSSSSITQATLRLYLSSRTSFSGAVLTAEYFDPELWPVESDTMFDAVAIDTAGTEDIDGMTLAAYAEIDLANPNAFINKEGYTAFRLVATGTTNITNELLFESFGDANDPELLVTYTNLEESKLFTGSITPAGSLAGKRNLRRSFGGIIGPRSAPIVDPADFFDGLIRPSGELNPETPGVDLDQFDIALAEYGFMTEPGTVRSDITAALPRISVATEAKKRADFGELDTIAQESWHHGRGQYRFSDPASYFDSRYCDTRIPDQVIRSPKRHATFISGQSSPSLVGSPVDMRYWKATDTVYLLTNNVNQLFRWDNDSSVWVKVDAASSTLSGDPQRLMTFTVPDNPPSTTTVDYLLISRGHAEPYVYSLNDGVTWSEAPTGDYGSNARVFAQFKERLAFDIANTSIVLRPNPTEDDASTSVLINNLGSGDEEITNLQLLGEALIVLKEGSVYQVLYNPVVDAYETKLIIDYSNMRHPDNGKGAYVKDGALYFNVLQSVMEFNGTTIRPVGPDLGSFEESIAVADVSGVIQVRSNGTSFQGPEAAKRGTVLSMTGDPNWLYGAVEPYEGSTRTVTAYGGTGWHDLTEEEDQAGGFVAYLPKLASDGVLATPTLWYKHGTSIKYLLMPLGTDNRWDYAAADYEDEADSQLITPWFDADLLEVWKDWLHFMVTMELRTTLDNIYVEFQVNGDDTWKPLGQTVGLDVLRFPDNSLTIGHLRARSIRMRLTLNGQVKLTGYFFKFLSRPFPRYGWQVRVIAGRLLDLLNNTVSTLTSEEHKDRLYELRKRPGPIRFSDGRTESGLHNYLKNPGFEGWNAEGTLPVRWTAVGSPSLAQETQYAYQGGYSCAAVVEAGEGLVSDATASLPADDYHAIARLRVVSGTVKVEVLKDSVSVAETTVGRNVIPYDFGSLGLEAFQRVSVPYMAATAGSYQLKITGLTASTFQVDACEFREGEDDLSPYIAEGEQRCRSLVPGTFHDSVAVRLPYWLCYISGIAENFNGPERDLNGVRYSTVFLVELREAD